MVGQWTEYDSKYPLLPTTITEYPGWARLDLRCQKDVDKYFKRYRPERVFLLAARVGGIMANMEQPGEFLYDNLMIQSNVIEAARVYEVQKLIFLGSSCIYPRLAPQPMKEEYLLTGSPEPTNESYGLAKIAGIKMCEAYNRQYKTNFISLIPPNLYGPCDNFTDSGHVIAGLIKKFHLAKETNLSKVVLWGDGSARREFLYVRDLVEAMWHVMENVDASLECSFYNVGSGKDISIRELADLIKQIVGYKGSILWDKSMPNGMPQKLLDSSKFKDLTGWKDNTTLEEGISDTYEWYYNFFLKGNKWL